MLDPESRFHCVKTVAQDLFRRVLRKYPNLWMNLDVDRNLALFRSLIVCNAGMQRARYALHANPDSRSQMGVSRPRKKRVDVRFSL
jgi:hypothetical protein